jgi:hypothetical protein
MKALRYALIVLVLIGAERAVSSQGADRPVLVSATYWGGSSIEEFAAVTVDATGSVYVAGTTSSPNFPKTISTMPALGGADVFVSKFDAAGSLVFSTTFGGSSSDRVTGLAIDAAGGIIVVGETFSEDLPVVNPIQPNFHPSGCGEFGGVCSDGFAARVDPTGHALTFSTYLGTTTLDTAMDVAVDAAGNIYVVGATGAPFAGVTPVRAFTSGREAFIAKIPPAGGAFTYFTYLGGTFDDGGNGIAVDPAGNAYVTGVSSSQNFPTLNPIQAVPENFSDSAFVTKLGPTGAIVYSTYLSGIASDVGLDIAVDAAGRALVVGITASTNFPSVNASQPFLRGFNDVFVAKLAASGSSLVYSTYLGGNDWEQAQGLPDFSPALSVTLDAGGNAYVSGVTQSVDFPSVNALEPFGGGLCLIFPQFELRPCPDAFVTKLDAGGRLAFSSPIGGSRDDRGRGVAVAPDGVVYVVGNTSSTDFPVRAPLQAALSGTSDAFIVKMSTAPPDCRLPAPAQLAPAGGIFNQRPAFSWAPVAGAETYAVIGFNLGHLVLTGTPPAHLFGITTSTSLTPAAALAPGDYAWQVVAWNQTCGLGQFSRGTAFTLPGICPAPTATLVSPVGGGVVNNPIRLEWGVSGPSIAALSIVVILRADGKFVAQYPALTNTFTLPMTLSTGDYAWFVVTWNSTCGATLSTPAFFRSSGGVGP